MTDPGPGQAAVARIAAAMAYLEGAGDRRPDLAEVAAAIGLQPHDLQQIFSDWAGVGAGDVLRHLAPDPGRRLCDPARVPQEAGQGLALSWEVCSPDDHARKGKGVTIRWGWFDSPFGPVLAMATGRGLCGLAFAAETGEAAAMADLRGRWPGATYLADAQALAGPVEAAFAGRGAVALDLIGAPFQIKVWEVLLRIPPGMVATYTDIARAIGTPKAVRAVGTAVGRNPISWLVPCHRALRRDGSLGGYHWGLGVKRAMLAWESARSAAP